MVSADSWSTPLPKVEMLDAGHTWQYVTFFPLSDTEKQSNILILTEFGDIEEVLVVFSFLGETFCSIGEVKYRFLM